MDIVFVELPEIGKSVKSGNEISVIESVKAASDIYSPIDGEIIEINNENRVLSCGSCITACVLALAYSLVNNKYSPTIYDGSWAEYGKI